MWLNWYFLFRHKNDQRMINNLVSYFGSLKEAEMTNQSEISKKEKTGETKNSKKKNVWGIIGKFFMYGGWILIVVIGLVIALLISFANSGSS